MDVRLSRRIVGPRATPRRPSGVVASAGRAFLVAALFIPLTSESLDAVQPGASLLVRAGELDGPGALGEVFDVELGWSDELLVVQPRVPTIAVFGPSGQFVRNIGRGGGGPGEFMGLGRIGITGDVLWVMDPVGGRLHLYNDRYELQRTVMVDASARPGGVTRLFPGPLMADGSILAIPFAPGSASPEPIMLLNEDGSLRRMLARVAMAGRVIEVRVTQGPAGSVNNPWADTPLWTNARDGQSVVILDRQGSSDASPSTFGILRIGLGGDTLANRRVTYTPVPLGAADRDRAHASIAATLALSPFRTGGQAQLLRDAREGVPAPRFHPPVTEVIAGRDGTIWVRREPRGDGLAQWQVFGEDGGDIGAVLLPGDLRVYGAERARVWGVRKDELDVSYVEVYRVQAR